MNKLYKLLFVLLTFLFSVTAFSQQKFFSTVSESAARSSSVGSRTITPEKFVTTSANVQDLRTFLWALPAERNLNRSNAPILELPMPDGSTAKFRVWQSSIQEPSLEARFPNIKTFAGQGIDDPYASIRFDFTEFGFHAQINSPVSGTVYIDPYKRGDTKYYMSYLKSENKRNPNVRCENVDIPVPNGITGRPSEVPVGLCRGTQLYTYRLAVACTGEYAIAVGGTTPALLHSAIVTSVNRVDGIYETEIAVRLILIANNNLVEFLDPATDPFNGNDNPPLLLNESQTVMTNFIGAPNYDIGHTFSTGGGGVAQLGSVCGPNKARGVTGLPTPVGDAFDIDFVAHEIGHQFGGSHPFNGAIGNCSGGNRNGATAYEVGSGTTIQAYAGICGSDNLQPNSDAFFHTVSFDQISVFVEGGGSCHGTIATGNGIPVITTMESNGVSIPINTPFTLNATATDPNGDAITYCWEQWDLGAQGTWNSGGTTTDAPIFKSRIPKITGSRTFPDAAVIAANYPANPAATLGGLKGEILPQVARELKFRLTVRDNRTAGGGVVTGGSGCGTFSAPFVVNVTGTTPFTVLIPNGGQTYPGGSTQTITWNNAGTNAAPFNVPLVRVLYSSDGGLTFPTVLSASTPNDGSEDLVIPSTPSTTSRIKIEAVGNIFFDISNTNFTISAPVNGFTFGATTTSTSPCPATADPTITIPTTVNGTFTTPIILSTTPATALSFAPNPLTPGSSAVATLNNASTLPAGTYTYTVTGTAGTVVRTTTVTYVIAAGAGPAISLQPAAQTVCVPAPATFTVTTAAVGATYQWQSAPTIGGTYTNIVGATNASYTTGATTFAMNGMGYRCIVSTQCGSTTSANALLTVNTIASITTQPTNQQACTGSTATFTSVGAGTGVTYQWQSSALAAGPFTDIVGAISPNYTTGPVTTSTDGFYRVVVTTTTCPNVVISNVVQLTISTTTAINTQPVNQTVCVPAPATFSVSAVGTSLAYQWQSAPTVTGTFTNIGGATAASYTTPASTTAANGTAYRVIVTGTCNTVTSSIATITVNTAAAVTTQPTDQTVCNGVTATFTGGGSGTGATFQWQESTSLTGPFTNVTTGTGGTTATYTTAVTTPAMNNTFYRLVVSTTACPLVVSSNPARLTVNTVANITTQPTVQSACVPETATFTVAAIGTGLSYQWQVSAGGGAFANIAGATSATYTTPANVLANNGNQYRVNILSTCSPTTPTTSNAVTLTVNNPVTVTANPLAQRGCAGDNFTFSVTATGGNLAYQWQTSSNGGPFVNVTPGVPASPATSGTGATYTINNAPLFLNGSRYRVVVSAVPCGLVVTPAVPLVLSERPSVVLTAGPVTSQNPFLPSVLVSTVSPANGNYTYIFRKDGVVLPLPIGTTSIPLLSNDFGTFQLSVSDVITGCTAVSNSVTISAIPSTNLFVYPNPVTSMMQVRQFSSDPATRGTTLNVYDSKGQRVFSKAYTIAGTFGRMDVDMTKMQQGLYFVELRDASGKKLAATQVLKGL